MQYRLFWCPWARHLSNYAWQAVSQAMKKRISHESTFTPYKALMYLTIDGYLLFNFQPTLDFRRDCGKLLHSRLPRSLETLNVRERIHNSPHQFWKIKFAMLTLAAWLDNLHAPCRRNSISSSMPWKYYIKNTRGLRVGHPACKNIYIYIRSHVFQPCLG
jgi:hypothetical protein